MKLFTNPKINKTNPDKWYIEFNHIVPVELRELHPRSAKRFKKYGDINRYKGEEREANAKDLCAQWLWLLKSGHNPFEAIKITSDKFSAAESEVVEIEERVNEIKEVASKMTEEDLRKLTPVKKAFELFISALEERNKNSNSLSTFRGTITWLTEYFEENKRINDPISSIRHLEISTAVMEAKKKRDWGNTTYNKEVNTAMTIFNWLATEEYIHKNPSSGRIKKLKTQKSKHKWYDREIAKIVKRELLQKSMPVYRAAQFTYWLCIRSKKELMMLKVSDIDTKLKRIRFSKELSKDGNECYRDYPKEFELVLREMNFDTLPKHFYVFGKNGEPSDKKCHKDFLAEQFRPIRDGLGLSDDYTIYSWKHTSVIHLMMKKEDPYQIQHKLRHDNLQTTLDYMRDFDITLANIYNPEDLTF